MNVIDDMRARLQQNFRGMKKPVEGLGIFQTPIAKQQTFRPTANNMPRTPQSSIPNPRPKYDTAGRPPVRKDNTPPLYRTKPKDIWGGWL